MAISTNTRISIGKARLEGEVVHVIRTWALAFPAELVQFDKEMKYHRSIQHKKNGMSRNGNGRWFGDVPVRLHKAMMHQFGNSWMYDNVLRDTFWQHFEVGKVTKYARMTKA